MLKNDDITVRSENGKGVTCRLIDIDYGAEKIWVRFPTNQVLEMNFNSKRNLYVGRMARLEFTVDPNKQ